MTESRGACKVGLQTSLQLVRGPGGLVSQAAGRSCRSYRATENVDGCNAGVEAGGVYVKTPRVALLRVWEVPLGLDAHWFSGYPKPGAE